MTFPATMRVFERGWLSSNNVVFLSPRENVLVDSGYYVHAAQTLALVQQALDGAPLHRLLNTHLHSDHCGGNAHLQAEYPGVETAIPPGQAEAVRRWDEAALHYRSTGQTCPRFVFDRLLQPGTVENLGGQAWEVHAAPGHDPDAVLLYCPAERLLISADALWEDGFGVLFPELAGEPGFAEQRAVLELIGRLKVETVIPGHGPPFADVSAALVRAHARLDAFQADPARHALHALKVLIVFLLMEKRRMPMDELRALAEGPTYFKQLAERHFGSDAAGVLQTALAKLEAAGVVRREATVLVLN